VGVHGERGGEKKENIVTKPSLSLLSIFFPACSVVGLCQILECNLAASTGATVKCAAGLSLVVELPALISNL
jgi:hypothetical protein